MFRRSGALVGDYARHCRSDSRLSRSASRFFRGIDALLFSFLHCLSLRNDFLYRAPRLINGFVRIRKRSSIGVCDMNVSEGRAADFAR